jgi:CHAT domain-containing protein
MFTTTWNSIPKP